MEKNEIIIEDAKDLNSVELKDALLNTLAYLNIPEDLRGEVYDSILDIIANKQQMKDIEKIVIGYNKAAKEYNDKNNYGMKSEIDGPKNVYVNILKDTANGESSQPNSSIRLQFTFYATNISGGGQNVLIVAIDNDPNLAKLQEQNINHDGR